MSKVGRFLARMLRLVRYALRYPPGFFRRVVGSFHSPPTSSGAGGGLRREENDRRDEPNDVGR